MPPVSTGTPLPQRHRTLFVTPGKLRLSVELECGGWSTFTPPRHAAHAARCGLFLLRRSYPNAVLPCLKHDISRLGAWLAHILWARELDDSVRDALSNKTPNLFLSCCPRFGLS